MVLRRASVSFLVAASKIPERKEGKRVMFCLTVSEGSVSGCSAPCAWEEHQGSGSEWRRNFFTSLKTPSRADRDKTPQ
jgi:hypothetical protein